MIFTKIHPLPDLSVFDVHRPTLESEDLLICGLLETKPYTIALISALV